MARTGKRPSRRKKFEFDAVFYRGVEAVGGWVTQNPSLVGGATAFLIAMSFVSANAIWYQPHAHTSPLFSTRSFQAPATTQDPASESSTTIRLARPEVAPVPEAKPEPARPAAGDPATARVQSILKDLGYYKGEVDGLSGPATSSAISAYQRKMGLNVSGRIDNQLLSELGANDVTGSIAPEAEPTDGNPTEGPVPVARIQEGLRAFGNTDIDVDGVLGKRTRDGIREFQVLFGLADTGEPNAEVYQKMLAEGLLQ